MLRVHSPCSVFAILSALDETPVEGRGGVRPPPDDEAPVDSIESLQCTHTTSARKPMQQCEHPERAAQSGPAQWQTAVMRGRDGGEWAADLLVLMSAEAAAAALMEKGAAACSSGMADAATSEWEDARVSALNAAANRLRCAPLPLSRLPLPCTICMSALVAVCLKLACRKRVMMDSHCCSCYCYCYSVMALRPLRQADRDGMRRERPVGVRTGGGRCGCSTASRHRHQRRVVVSAQVQSHDQMEDACRAHRCMIMIGAALPPTRRSPLNDSEQWQCRAHGPSARRCGMDEWLGDRRCCHPTPTDPPRRAATLSASTRLNGKANGGKRLPSIRPAPVQSVGLLLSITPRVITIKTATLVSTQLLSLTAKVVDRFDFR